MAKGLPEKSSRRGCRNRPGHGARTDFRVGKNISSVVEMIRLGATDDEIVTSVKDMTRFALDDIKKTELQKYGFGFSQNLIDPQYARVVSRYLFDSGLVGVKKAESIEKRIGAGAVRYYQLATWIGGTDNTQWLIQKSVYGLVENTRMLDELHMERTQRY